MEFDLLEDPSNGWGAVQWPVIAADPIVADGINGVLDYENLFMRQLPISLNQGTELQDQASK